MIELNNIHVIFNQHTQLENHVLKGIDLKIAEGEFVTIIGGNGAGKSTLMNVLAGDVLPNKGKILIADHNVTKWVTERRSKWVARIFQDPSVGTFSNLSIEENLCIAHRRGKTRRFSLSFNKTLKEKFEVALSEIGLGLEHRLKDSVSTLSGGQRQALSLVMATLQGSKILLLDEHTAALDPKIAKTIMEVTHKIIHTHHLTALMITHSMTQALAYGTRTIMLYHGKVVKDIKGEERKKLSSDDLINYFD